MNQPELIPLDNESITQLPDEAFDQLPTTAWAQGLVQLIEVQEKAFVRTGLDAAEAFRLARTATLAIAEYHGGRQWYLPRGDDLLTALRDAEIYRRARRGNIRALAQEHGLTDQHVWRIIRQQRKLHLDKMQGRLFDQGD